EVAREEHGQVTNSGCSSEAAELAEIKPHRRGAMFDILIESNPEIRPKKTLFSLIISILLHTTILMVAIITPLFFTDTLNPQQLVMTYLVAPPPPPPPPPPPLATTTKAM